MLEALQGWWANIGPALPAAFVLAALVTVWLTPKVRRLAIARGVVDRPDRVRRIHTRSVPRWGGLAIAAGFFLSLILLTLLGSGLLRYFVRDLDRVIVVGVGGLAMLALGAYDDARGANAWVKLAVQIPAALLLVALGFSFEVISLPWGGALEVGPFGSVLAVVWVVGVTNAINLIDGLDGLAAGVAFLAVAATFVVAVAGGNLVMALVCAALAGALLGFLFHNFHPASIFMGDAGSLFIGYVVAATSVMANFKSQTTVALGIPVLLLGLPIVDTLLAFFRRMLRGRSPFTADREHIHHRLLSRGLSHRAAVLAMWGMALLCAVATLMVYFSSARDAVWVLLGYGVLVFVGARRLGYLRFEQWGAEFRRGRTQRDSRRTRNAQVTEIATQIAGASELTEAFDRFVTADKVHRSDEVRLEVHGADGPALRLVWRRLPDRWPPWAHRATVPDGAAPEPVERPHFEACYEFPLPAGFRAQVHYATFGAGPLNAEDEAALAPLHAAMLAAIARHLGLADQPVGVSGERSA